MTLPKYLDGLRIHFGGEYRFEGKRYLAGYEEDRVAQLMRELHQASFSAQRLDWLLAHRAAIREITSLKTRIFLSYRISATNDIRDLRFALWFRGRGGGYAGSAVVARLATHPNPSIRKEVARTLRRLSAWPALREMATHDPNPRIRALASQPPSRPFERRQEQFLEGMSIFKTSAAPTPLMISPKVDITQARPTRQPWFIRQVLMRIHALVTGA